MIQELSPGLLAILNNVKPAARALGLTDESDLGKVALVASLAITTIYENWGVVKAEIEAMKAVEAAR